VTLRPVDDTTYTALAAGTPLPVEQAPVWAAFDAVVPGRSHWGRLAYDDDGVTAAVVTLAEVRGPGGFRYLWAKNGPVWLVEPTPEREEALRRELGERLGRVDPRLRFAPLHARPEAPDLRPVTPGITRSDGRRVGGEG